MSEDVPAPPPQDRAESAGGAGAGRAGAAADDGWRRLAGRMVAVHGVRLLLSLAPLAIALVVGGGDLDLNVVIALVAIFGGAALRSGADIVSWATTRYRVTPERVELRSGLLRRSELSIPRDRVRTVNVTAKPLHRLFGLATVEVGTGRSDKSSTLRLDAIPAAEAAPLRSELLIRTAAAPAGTTPPHAAPAGEGAAAAATGGVASTTRADATGTSTTGADATGTGATGAGVAGAGVAGAGVPGEGAVSAGATRAGATGAGATSAGATSAGATGAGALGTGGAGGELLASIRWRWLPYHLLSPWTLALPLVVLGGALQALDSIGVDGTVRDAASDGYDRAQELPIGLAVAVLVGFALVVGVVAASAIFVESWWGYRLTREPGGTLHVRRGLLTSRSITIEQRRLRGIQLAESLPLRAAGGATLLAVVSGLKGSDDGKSARVDALLPAAPEGEATRVVAEVLHEPDAPRQLAVLAAHPRAALRRRLSRAASATAALVATATVAGPVLGWLPDWAPALAAVATVPALLLARDAYRSLGHGLAGRHLVTRHGTFVRRTVALERDGVIGWNLARSPLQRRARLATLTATTAAGSGGYRVVDVGVDEGVAFAAEAVPGILDPFLVQRDSEGTSQGPGLRTNATTAATTR
jgi:putative membrane protein